MAGHHQHAESQAQEHQRPTELGRQTRVQTVAVEFRPEPGEQRTEGDHENGADGRGLPGRPFHAKGGAVHDAFREGHPAAVALLVQTPEQCADHDQGHQDNHAAAFGGGDARKQEFEEPDEQAQAHDHGDHFGHGHFMTAGNGTQKAEVHFHLKHLPHHQHRKAAGEINPPFAADAGEPGRRQCRRIRRFGLSGQMFLAQHELHQTQRHHHPGQTEAVPPADFLADVGHDQRGQGGTDVDAHVENGEARITARVVVGIQAADNGGNVRFEKAHTHRNQRQGGIHDLDGKRILSGLAGDALRRGAGIGHAQLPQHQQQAAEHHRFAHAEPTIGQSATKQRQGIGQTGIGAQQQIAVVIGKQVVLGQIQKQQGLHAIERETLPHLGHEADE